MLKDGTAAALVLVILAAACWLGVCFAPPTSDLHPPQKKKARVPPVEQSPTNAQPVSP